MSKKKITIEIEVPEDFQDHNLRRVIRAAECAASEDYLVETWSIEDVQYDNAELNLTDDQAREVLGRVDAYHDCNIGINWEVIRYHAECVKDESEE